MNWPRLLLLLLLLIALLIGVAIGLTLAERPAPRDPFRRNSRGEWVIPPLPDAGATGDR